MILCEISYLQSLELVEVLARRLHRSATVRAFSVSASMSLLSAAQVVALSTGGGGRRGAGSRCGREVSLGLRTAGGGTIRLSLMISPAPRNIQRIACVPR